MAVSIVVRESKRDRRLPGGTADEASKEDADKDDADEADEEEDDKGNPEEEVEDLAELRRPRLPAALGWLEPGFRGRAWREKGG